jgi:hypothetical protein
MITNFRRNLQRDEAGQAIILGAVSFLVLAVGIMTTAQLGWAIKERVRLQHAADNAAYTTAAMVARSLNFIAWTNRAMIAQYVSAMAFQSLVSYLNALTVLMAQVVASLLTIAFYAGIAARVLQATIIFSWLSPPFELISQVFGRIGDRAKDPLLTTIRDGLDSVDEFVAKIVYGISVFNKKVNYTLMQHYAGKGYMQAYFGMGMVSEGISLITGGSGGGGGNFYKDSIEETAPGANKNAGAYDLLASTLGSGQVPLLKDLFLGYEQLFDKHSEKAGTSDKPGVSNVPEIERAERLMTELANGTRAGNGTVKFETGREGGITSLISLIIKGGGESAGKEGNQFLDFLKGILPNSQGAALLTRPIDPDHGYLGAHDRTTAKKVAEKNPVFMTASANSYQVAGTALNSTDVVLGALGSLPWPLDKIMDFVSTAGELIPQSKAVGIQAVGVPDGESYLVTRNIKSGHCRYYDVVAIKDGSICGKMNDGAGDAEEECKKDCGECTQWNQDKSECLKKNRPCSECPDAAKEAEESVKNCREGMDAANDALYSTLFGIFNGVPAKVDIRCDNHGDGRHKFLGVTPYVSFDIEGYKKRQDNKHAEEYPSFWGFAHKKPTFIKNGALGFGDKFKDRSFSMSSIGVVEGVTSKNVGKCDDAFNGDAQECSKNGYNFNYMEDDDVKFIISGMHAWARSQVYYHRPGTWAEPPNFFNPYWKPKLSPIAPIFTNQTSRLSSIPLIGGILSGVIGDVIETILSH